MVVAAVCAVAQLAFPSEYFVAPDGSDDGPGTRSAPWQTLAKASAVPTPGDTVTFLRGDYPGMLAPANDGEPGQPVVFRGAEPEAARFVGGGGRKKGAISLEGRKHIILDGLAVEPRSGSPCLTARECSHLTIRNCRMENARYVWQAVTIKQSDNIRVLDNTIRRNVSFRSGEAITRRKPEWREEERRVFGELRTSTIYAEVMGMVGCRSVLLQGNRITHGGHSICYVKGERVVVRRNLFAGRWGRVMVVSADQCLVEENIVTGAVDSGGSAGPGGNFKVTHGIVRRNLIARNWGLPLSHGFPVKHGKPVGYLGNSRHYHNTLCCNPEGALRVPMSLHEDFQHLYSNNVWKNNLFYNNNFSGSFPTLTLLVHPKQDNRFVHNLICGTRPGQEIINYRCGVSRQELSNESYTVPEAEVAVPERFSNNLDVVPTFVDMARDDFRLQSGSAGIDAGAFLTTATASGTGRRIPVKDATWFYDGFGIAGEQGDQLAVGAAKRSARVVRVDREQNLVIVDRDLEWQAGDTVTLPYVGAAPDMGAMEFGADGEPWHYRLVMPPDSYHQLPTDDKTPLLVCDFEDDTAEQWAFVWNTDRKRRTIHGSSAATAATGKKSFRIHALSDGASLAIDTEAWLWDVQRYPFVEFAYRIPKGVPIGIWLRRFDGHKSYDPRTCIGSSPALEHQGKLSQTYALRDDDRWHTLRVDARVIHKLFPELRYMRAFEFRNSTTKRKGFAEKGQHFWLDDFAIRPL